MKADESQPLQKRHEARGHHQGGQEEVRGHQGGHKEVAQVTLLKVISSSILKVLNPCRGELI